jgi:predicted nucleic acid-binding protein
MNEQRPHHELAVDTGVVVKFFVEEEDSDKADELLEDVLLGNLRLVALDFLFIEFANIMWMKNRLGELNAAQAEEKISQLLSLSALIEIVPVASVLVESLRIAVKHGLAAYDSALIALAENRGLRFITADGKLYRKIRVSSKAALSLSNWSRQP